MCVLEGEGNDGAATQISPSAGLIQTPTSGTAPPPEARDISQPTKQWCGFKLVGDNYDRNAPQRFQRLGGKTNSIHHFNTFAVLDRVDCQHLSDEEPTLPKGLVLAKQSPVWLSTSEINDINGDMEILIARYFTTAINIIIIIIFMIFFRLSTSYCCIHDGV